MVPPTPEVAGAPAARFTRTRVSCQSVEPGFAFSSRMSEGRRARVLALSAAFTGEVSAVDATTAAVVSRNCRRDIRVLSEGFMRHAYHESGGHGELPPKLVA